MRILLIEDEVKLASFIKRGLVAERYAVDVAKDGRSGLELAQTYQYDLLLLDLMLPGMDGSEVLRRIRKENSSVPVLILSARDTVQDKVANMETGADDYLTKPFAFAELSVRIKALMRRGPVNRASTIRVSDLELDRLSQQVKRAGQRIDLTAKEYALLEYLGRRAGELVNREEISEHVWDEEYDPCSNLIEVYMRRLRRKIDDDFKLKLLRTRRGEGYVLSPDEEGDA